MYFLRPQLMSSNVIMPTWKFLSYFDEIPMRFDNYREIITKRKNLGKIVNEFQKFEKYS